MAVTLQQQGCNLKRLVSHWQPFCMTYPRGRDQCLKESKKDSADREQTLRQFNFKASQIIFLNSASI